MSCIYTIPHEGRYIIYHPLKQIAFMANGAFVNLLAHYLEEGSEEVRKQLQEIAPIVFEGDFFAPAPVFPENKEHPLFRPTVAVLLLTTSCNLRCVYCYAHGGERPGEVLSGRMAKRVVDIACENACSAGRDHFLLSFHGGGEPTMAWKPFQELIQYARSLKLSCRISLASNGVWTEAQEAFILENVDSVSLSFDGVQEVQDLQRPAASGKGTFKQVLKTVKALDRSGLSYGIRITATDESAGRLSDSMDFFISETNCRTFQVEPAFGHGRAGRDCLALSNLHAFAVNFLAAYDKALAAGRHLYYSGARPWAICNRFCSAIENALIVAPDGGISACYEVCDHTHPLAGYFFIGRMKGPEVSIDNGVRNELLDRLHHRRKACENCFCFWHCAGDCPSKTLTPQGDGHLEFRQRCDLNRLLTKELLVRNIEKSGNIWQWFPQNNLNCY